MTYANLFDYAEAQKARDEGIERVMENAGEWKDEAMDALERIYYQRRYEGNEFTFEMLKFPVVKAVGPPHHSNVWGGIAREMKKRGWIKEVGTTQAQTVSRHGSICRVYKWSDGAMA